MANVIVTMRVMPLSPDVDLAALKEEVSKLVAEFGGEVGKSEEQAVAFGLKALMLYFVMDEAKGSTEELEKKVDALEGVNSVEVTDVRRAIG